MRNLLRILPALLLLNLSAQAMDALEPYRWKYRIIAYTLHDSDKAAFEHARMQSQPAARERDIRYLELEPKSKTQSPDHLNFPADKLDPLRTKLGATSGQTQLILIGKDGDVKSRIKEIDLQRLYDQIDQMPMRRSEIRSSQSE